MTLDVRTVAADIRVAIRRFVAPDDAQSTKEG
jgi:hypothetical protein